MTGKHEVQRMCCFCRVRKPKEELIRIVRNENGVHADPSPKTFGRSAYVCRDRACIDGMLKKRALDKSFRAHVDTAVYERLKEELETIE